MTRAAEFCYIAEMNGRYLQAITVGGMQPLFTKEMEMALRITANGRKVISAMFNGSIGFRKVLIP